MTIGMTEADRLILDVVRMFDAALGRLAAMLTRIADWPEDRQAALLSSRLAPDMFSFADQVRTAVQFTLRTALPLAGQAVPEHPEATPDLADLQSRIAAARTALALPDDAFAGAAERMITERAGFATLEMKATDFLFRFGLVNFHFHLDMAYALLRAAGAPVGKADIDGLHDYPPGFSF
jgi:hypothetical protein